jgi:hypothetical protein
MNHLTGKVVKNKELRSVFYAEGVSDQLSAPVIRVNGREHGGSYGIFGINVDFSRSLQSGFFFYPKDKDLSLGTTDEEKTT